MIKVTLDGKEVSVKNGQTILEACTQNGIHIPTLCHDDKLRPLGLCRICMVEVQGHGLVTSCDTKVWPEMVIDTYNDKIRLFRKRILELLLSEHYGDCVAPCQIACPAGVDIQGYLTLIRRGAYKEAAELIKETLPLPAVIGRICPHSCEEACRRSLVDQPISICSLKRFVADHELSEERFVPAIKPKSGFKIAIIGSGPAGLSAAYYLIQMGHEVTIFEALPKPGGMLRYGIPDYRLPKDILDQEITAITEPGVIIKTNQALGKDFTINSLLEDGFHAIFVAIGAHQSQKVSIEGEDLEGVLLGTDFLRSVASGQQTELGKRVVVIGGGNTAVDAARTALRLDAEEVTILYRRSRTEMPAAEWEVDEAEEEIIKIHFLAAPVRIMEKNGRVDGIECVKMVLGEPDTSGRRRPEPISGSEFVLPADSIIAAIGQRPDLSFLEKASDLGIERGNITADPDTLLTNIKGVFAGGDCVTGAATAVEAIAAGKKAAIAIGHYLGGEDLVAAKIPFNISKGKLNELLGVEEFVQVEHRPRRKMPNLRPNERRSNFQEIEFGYTEDMAKKEAERCLECGCKGNYDCTLRELATDYEVSAPSVRRGMNYYPQDKSHPFIERDSNKCIACARCARICHEVQGVGAVGLAYRMATPPFGQPLQETACESCGQCVTTCPVGAIVFNKDMQPACEVKTICPYCGCGCGIYLGIRGNTIVNVRGDIENPVNKGNLCVKGRFGHDFINHPDRLTSPLVKKKGEFVETTWEEALDLVAAKFSQHKGDKFAAISSARCTNEENYLVQKFARAVMGTNNIDHCARL